MPVQPRASLQAGLHSQPVGQAVIDGSLKFDGSEYLKRTPTSEGNRKRWTWSAWLKRYKFADDNTYHILFSTRESNSNRHYISYNADVKDELFAYDHTNNNNKIAQTNARYRDTGWYNVVVVYDTPNSDGGQRLKFFINGVENDDWSSYQTNGQNFEGLINSVTEHRLGAEPNAPGYFFGSMSQVYFIDGEVLGPENFGFTDPLTNTWRPKKYTGDFNIAPASGAVYSDFGYGDFNSSNPKENAFDGSTSTRAEPHDNDTVYFDFSHVNPSGTLLNYDGNASLPTYLNQGGLAAQDGLRNNPIYHAFDGNNSTYTDMTYLNGQYARLTFANPITNVTNITLGYDGEGDPGYNGGNHVTNVSFNGSRQSIQVYSGAAITLNNLDFISQPGNGVCRLYDVTITTSTQSATKLTLDGGVSVSSSLEVYTGKSGSPGANHFTVNGSNYGSSIPNTNWYTVSGVSKLKNIAMYHASGSSSVELFAVRVDSSILTDGTPASGVNSFYLPLDGNSPIGQDKSGNGNDFTPVNFGNNGVFENATGGMPILNTIQGGSQGAVGVFGSRENRTYTTTTGTNSGGKYVFANEGTQPTFSFIRGATYTFDYSASTSHPLRFATAADAAGSTQYTDGTSVSGNVIKFTVPHNAPDTLYYYCTNHNGMGNSISVTTDINKADPYAWKCTLALPLLGQSEDVSDQINSTSTQKTITNNGVEGPSRTTSNHYDGSFRFDGGSTDRLTVTYNSEFQFGTGDFCVEFWVNLSTSSGNQYFFDFDSNGGNFQYNSNVLSYSDASVAGSGPLYSTGITLDTDKWYHLAVTRESGTGRIFVNGVKRAEGTTTANYNQTSVLDIGNGYNNSGYEITGYMQDFRIYKGVAKYTSDFICGSTDPEITQDTPTGTTSSDLARISEGGIALDGSGDYLTVPDSADFDFGTGDYTAEAYFYPRAYADMYIINQSTDHGGAAPWWGLNVWSNGSSFTVRAGRTDSSGNARHEISYKWSTFKWTHIAVSRVSGTSRLYIDGMLESEVSDSDDIDGNGSLRVGAYNDGSLNWNGFLSNVRIVKGTGLYTEPRITPPMAPLDAVTNTKLLCCQSPTSATTAAVTPGSITANDNASATNFNPFNTDANMVRGQEGGYAVLNPFNMHNTNNSLSNGNLEFTTSGSDGGLQESTIGMSSGKFYFEVVYSRSSTGQFAGIRKPGARNYNDSYIYVGTAQKYIDGSSGTGYGESLAHGDIIGTAFDADNGTLEFFKNGQSQGQAFSGISGTYSFFVGSFGGPPTGIVNFGQKPFKFPPPDGFQSLSFASATPETVIPTPEKFQIANSYAATGGNQIITTGFKPDLIISKSRNQSYAWDWEDIVRGGGFKLRSNTNDASTDYCTNAPIREWRRDGVRCSTNLNSTYSGGGSNNAVSYSFVAGGNEIPNYGAISFDGNGDYLTLADTTAFRGHAGYTIDGWVYVIGAPANNNGYIIFDTGSGGSDPELNVLADGSGNIQLYDSLSNNANWNGGAPYMQRYRWHYFKQTVDGTSATDAAAVNKLYIDGQLGVQNTVNLSGRTSSSTAAIGGRTNGTVLATMILSNLRYRSIVDNSTDIPTKPFTSDSDTVLLCCNQVAPNNGSADPAASTTTPSTITKQGNPGNANIDIFGRFTKDGVQYASASAAGLATGGSNITPTAASIGTKTGFSIVTWNTESLSGSKSLDTGLGKKPDFVITKVLDQADDWLTFHKGISSTESFILNGNRAKLSNAAYTHTFNDDGTISGLVVGNPNWFISSRTYVFYSWCDIPGKQKFGSYEANNDSNGPFVYLGFRPAVLWVKRADATGSWYVLDNKRDTNNRVYRSVNLNSNSTEDSTTGSSDYLDFLSNGFKARIAEGSINGSDTYVYCAWAEQPTFNLYGAQSNAR